MKHAEDSAKQSIPQSTDGDDSLIMRKSAVLSRLGRYRIVCELASGGMAQVYLAVADGLEKLVALKVVHPHLAREEHFVHMFLDEARIASGIRHRNVCNVFDYGQEAGHYYMAMDFLAGRTLRDVMRRLRGKRPSVSVQDVVAFVASLIADAADGLHAAHELCDPNGNSLNIVHRDVSPHNIFVGFDGQASIIDFGIAHAEGRLQTTATGVLKGKFSYMAPEQIRDKNVDRRTDVWALGVCLWEALTQRRLFARDSQAETLMAVMTDIIRCPSELWPELPKALDTIVLRALARDPADRYASTRDFARDLRAFLRTSQSVLSADELEQRMLFLFPGEAEESATLVRRARSGSLTGLKAIGSDEHVAQRMGSVSGTHLRAAVNDVEEASVSVVTTPPTGTLTPSIRLSDPFVGTDAANSALPSGPLGAAHSDTPVPVVMAQASRSRFFMPVVAGGLLATGLLTAFLLWPHRPVPTAPAQLPLPKMEVRSRPAVPQEAPMDEAPVSQADTVDPGSPAQEFAEVLLESPKTTAPAKPVMGSYRPALRPVLRPAQPVAQARAKVEVSSVQTAEAPAVAIREPIAEPVPAEASKPEVADIPAPQAPKPAPTVTPALPVKSVYRGTSASFGVQQVHGALGSSAILRSLTRGTAGIEQCVATRGALLTAPPAALNASLTIEESGRISQVSARPHALTGLGACVEGVLSKLRSDQKPDVGTVSAEIQISFRAR
jgi:serine/threonine protein kinase